jgi:hypothetical protein
MSGRCYDRKYPKTLMAEFVVGTSNSRDDQEVHIEFDFSGPLFQYVVSYTRIDMDRFVHERPDENHSDGVGVFGHASVPSPSMGQQKVINPGLDWNVLKQPKSSLQRG